MTITIHRGIDQIGGCITEIRTARSKILIDLGHNLPKGNGRRKTVRQCRGHCTTVRGMRCGILHALSRRSRGFIPACAGAGRSIYRAVSQSRNAHPAGTPDACSGRERATGSRFDGRRAIQDLRTRPLYTGRKRYSDYVLFRQSLGSRRLYGFLVEADGKRILHTGDFRQHGYLGKGLLPTLEKYIAPQGIDVLITEGTMLDRNEKKIVHENDLKRQAIELMKRYKNVFVLCSSTDMDRLATFHRANREMRSRPFVCDGYQQRILESFAGHAGVKSPLFKFDHKVYGSDERNEKLRKWMLDTGFTMLLRTGPKYRRWVDTLLPELNPDETLLIYSMFRGYILPTHEAYNPDLKAFVAGFRTLNTCIHRDMRQPIRWPPFAARSLRIQQSFRSIGIKAPISPRSTSETNCGRKSLRLHKRSTG